MGNAWVSENDINIERCRQLGNGGVEVGCHKSNLSNSDHFHTLDPGKPLQINEFRKPVDIHHFGVTFVTFPVGGGLLERGIPMYTLGSLILLAILLGAVMPVFHSITSTVKLDAIINRLPVIKDHITLAVSILLVWALDISIVSTMTGSMRESWMTIVVDGCIVYGMVPVKDAIVQFISRGLTNLRAA
jgi:hypothetical protein